MEHRATLIEEVKTPSPPPFLIIPDEEEPIKSEIVPKFAFETHQSSSRNQ